MQQYDKDMTPEESKDIITVISNSIESANLSKSEHEAVSTSINILTKKLSSSSETFDSEVKEGLTKTVTTLMTGGASATPKQVQAKKAASAPVKQVTTTTKKPPTTTQSSSTGASVTSKPTVPAGGPVTTAAPTSVISQGEKQSPSGNTSTINAPNNTKNIGPASTQTTQPPTQGVAGTGNGNGIAYTGTQSSSDRAPARNQTAVSSAAASNLTGAGNSIITSGAPSSSTTQTVVTSTQTTNSRQGSGMTPGTTSTTTGDATSSSITKSAGKQSPDGNMTVTAPSNAKALKRRRMLTGQSTDIQIDIPIDGFFRQFNYILFNMITVDSEYYFDEPLRSMFMSDLLMMSAEEADDPVPFGKYYTVRDIDVKGLASPINFTIPLVDTGADNETHSRQCVYFDTTEEYWTTNDCKGKRLNEETMLCCSYRMGQFGIMLLPIPKEEDQEPKIAYLSYTKDGSYIMAMIIILDIAFVTVATIGYILDRKVQSQLEKQTINPQERNYEVEDKKQEISKKDDEQLVVMEIVQDKTPGSKGNREAKVFPIDFMRAHDLYKKSFQVTPKHHKINLESEENSIVQESNEGSSDQPSDQDRRVLRLNKKKKSNSVLDAQVEDFSLKAEELKIQQEQQIQREKEEVKESENRVDTDRSLVEDNQENPNSQFEGLGKKNAKGKESIQLESAFTDSYQSQQQKQSLWKVYCQVILKHHRLAVPFNHQNHTMPRPLKALGTYSQLFMMLMITGLVSIYLQELTILANLFIVFAVMRPIQIVYYFLTNSVSYSRKAKLTYILGTIIFVCAFIAGHTIAIIYGVVEANDSNEQQLIQSQSFEKWSILFGAMLIVELILWDLLIMPGMIILKDKLRKTKKEDAPNA